MKNQAFQKVILHKKLENAKLTNKKHGKPTLHSLMANHVLEMSVKPKFQCSRFKTKHCFALAVLKQFRICFCQGLFTRCGLYHRIFLHCSAETKEIIYESVNLKGVVWEPKQNSFRLNSFLTRTGFANVGPIFYKVHFLNSEQIFN